MKRGVLILFVGLIAFMNKGNAQSPNWTVNENNFQYTMTYLGFISVDGVTLSSVNDKVGAFVNGECRGVANLIYESSQKRYYAYLTVFSNIENETVSFKMYDATKNAIKNAIKTAPFVINNHTGSLLQAYCFSNISLSSNAELTDLNFTNATRKSISFTNNNVNIAIDKLQDITALNSTFVVSANASVFVNGINIASGSNSVNYTNLVTFRVRSQDESVVKDWVVNLTTPILFYRKNVTCYAKGEIKVDCPKNGSQVSLSLNGQQIASQQIVNGTTTFKNLIAGNYSVSTIGITKTISIINL